MRKQKMILKDLITSNWTLFLDRDGVINKRIPDNYVICWEQFEFLPGVLDAISVFSKLFSTIVVVTNQQGINKGLMTETDLLKVHSQMLDQIENNNGKINKIYHCPNLRDENHIDRKPNIGMALKARKDFPGINFKRSVMVGDSLSDMEFGDRLGMINVYISADKQMPQTNVRIDFLYESLSHLAKDLK